MSNSTLPPLLLTIPWGQVPPALLSVPTADCVPTADWRLLPVIREIARLIQQFRTSDITPASAFQFEHALNGLLREIGRLIRGRYLPADSP